MVNCSGRVKEVRKHPTRPDLDNVCLVNVIITPIKGDSVLFEHLWVLKRQLRKAKIPIKQGERIHFLAKVYRYRRKGGRSMDRGIYGNTDYGLSPREV